MPKKFMIIIINFFVIIILAFMLKGQIDKFKGLQDVYVARTFIGKGVKITNDMIEVKRVTVNREAAPNSKDRATYYDDVIKDPKKILGKFAAYDMIPGEIIIADKISADINTSDQYLYTMPKGYYAYVIPTGIEGEAGLIRVNDYIDLYINFKSAETADEPALRHLRVYDLRSQDGKSVTDGAKDDKGQPIAPKYAVLALNDYQLKKIIAYETQGATIKAALRKRPATDYEIFDNPENVYPTYSITPDTIVDEAKELELIEQNKIRIQSEAALRQENEKNSDKKN